MQELLLTNVDDAVLQGLRIRANQHGRTPAEEANAILTDALSGSGAMAWTSVDAIYERLAASGRTFSDSADLLRGSRPVSTIVVDASVGIK